GREQAGAGHHVETEALVMRDGRARRGRPLAADHLGLALARIEQDDRNIAAGAVEMRLGHLPRGRGRAGGIECVGALLEDRHADRGRDPVRRRDDAESSLDLGTGRERIWIDVAHGTHNSSATNALPARCMTGVWRPTLSPNRAVVILVHTGAADFPTA